MVQKVHLHDGLLHRHGLDGELLAPDDFEFLVTLVLRRGRDVVRDDFTLKSALPQPLLQAGLVAADLPLDGGHAGIHRRVHVVGQLACTVVQAVVMDGDLRQIPAPLHAEGHGGLRLRFEQAVQLADLLLRIGAQGIRGTHLFLSESELHFANSFLVTL